LLLAMMTYLPLGLLYKNIQQLTRNSQNDCQVLDVSKNALTEVPDTINGCKALAVLDLSVNPLGKHG